MANMKNKQDEKESKSRVFAQATAWPDRLTAGNQWARKTFNKSSRRLAKTNESFHKGAAREARLREEARSLVFDRNHLSGRPRGWRTVKARRDAASDGRSHRY